MYIQSMIRNEKRDTISNGLIMWDSYKVISLYIYLTRPFIILMGDNNNALQYSCNRQRNMNTMY